MSDFLFLPVPCLRRSTAKDCICGRCRLEARLEGLERKRHPTKGYWGGSTLAYHLGVHTHTSARKLNVAKGTHSKLMWMSKELLLLVHRNRHSE